VTTSAVPASGAWQARARYCRGLGERDGIAAYCRLENKVSLGFVEGLNNKIRVIQRRAHGLRNEEYPRLKILTCMLPAL
jgi:transposase